MSPTPRRSLTLGVVDDAVEDSIGDSGFADHLMPAREGQLAEGRKNGDEDLCLMHGAGGWIGDRNRVARIIGLHDRPRLVSVAKARTGAFLKGPKLLAKPSIAIAVGVGRPVFLPQKHQGDALALQLRGNLGPIWLLKVLRWTAHPLEQRRIIVAPQRQRPNIEASLTRPQNVGRYSRLAQLQPKPHLPDGEALLMHQPQNGSYILHGHSPRLLASWRAPSRSLPRSTECRDIAANDQPSHPTRNCPGLTEIPVRDFAKPARSRVRNGFSVRFVVFLPFDKRLHTRSQQQSHFMAMGLRYPAPKV